MIGPSVEVWTSQRRSTRQVPRTRATREAERAADERLASRTRAGGDRSAVSADSADSADGRRPAAGLHGGPGNRAVQRLVADGLVRTRVGPVVQRQQDGSADGGSADRESDGSAGREKLSREERQRLGDLSRAERMERLRELESPTGSEPGVGGYLEHTEENVEAFTTFFESRIPGGIGVEPSDLLVLSSDVSRENPGFEELPPRDRWSEMVPTLRLLGELGTAAGASFDVRSAYRSDVVNALSGGALNSSHMSFAALDVTPTEKRGAFEAVAKQYWWTRGRGESFGLGFYRPGRVHVDTLGFRRWQWKEETREESRARYDRYFPDGGPL